MARNGERQDTTIHIRLSERLLLRIEHRTRERQTQRPGESISVSDVIRSLLERGLERGDDG